ncbi:MAG: fibrillarin-like rRNA/tRNA 2'-O-methyltransferase [Candidatus Nanohalobium sp.]
MEEIQPGIYRENDNLYTVNANPGEKVYGEGLYDRDGREFRAWHGNRSKAAAAVLNGVDLGIEKDDEVLYLGASTGTTVSHFSDILADGFIYAVEYSDTVIRNLVNLAEKRENIAPILGDARKPAEYEDLIDGKVDVVFQDISQSDQPEIFTKNAENFLKEDGVALIAVKAHSISTSKDEEEVFQEVKNKLSENFEIVEEVKLEPYENNHLFLKMELKGETQ